MKIEGKRIIAFIIKKSDFYYIHLADTENYVDGEYKKTVIRIDNESTEKIANLFLNDKYAFVGYGNKYNDNIILNYIIKNYEAFKITNASFIKQSIERTLNSILVDKDEKLEKEYKYVKVFNSFDLQAFMFPKDQKIDLSQFINTSNYKYSDESHDIDNIVNILYDNENRINARLKVEDIYNIDLFDSCEGVVGAKLIKDLYLSRNKLKWTDIKDKKSYVRQIKLNDIIFPEIKFYNDNLNVFLNKLKNKIILPSDNISEIVYIKDDSYEVNLAGLRKNTEPCILKSDSNGDVYNIDIASFWPSILSTHKIKPSQVNDTFLDIYIDMWTTRLGFKITDTDTSTAMKYMLNGTIGQFMIEDSWLYDPIASFKIRINGALLMLMLVERLYNNFDIQCVTVDGMFIKSKNVNSEDILHSIISNWESESMLKADINKYDYVYLLSNNDYVTSNMTYKGLFQNHGNNGRINCANIIREAVINNLTNNVSVKEFVINNTNIRNFIIPVISNYDSYKWNDKIFKYARMYYSNESKLCKINDSNGFEKSTVTPVTKSGVTIIDEIPDSFPDNVDYQYYISEANNIISKIKEQQLSLF